MSGYCSFPAEDCESGRRYGDFSGPFSAQCVLPDGGTGDGTLTSSTSEASTGDGPTESTFGTGLETTTTDAATTDATGLGACARSELCVPTPPEPWLGPARLALDDTACEGTTVFEGFTGYDGQWSCICSCDVDAPPSCSGSGVDLEYFDEPACDGDPVATEDVSSSCGGLDIPGSYYVRPTTEQPAACTTNPALMASAVTPTGPQIGCEVDEGPACDGGSCYDAEQTLCVYAEGELACPEGDFGSRSVIYLDYVDDRDCGVCGCEGSYSCGGAVAVYTSDAGCNGPAFPANIGSCSDDASMVSAAEVGVLDISSTTACEVSGGEEIGEVTPTIPVTVCCR